MLLWTRIRVRSITSDASARPIWWPTRLLKPGLVTWSGEKRKRR